MTGAFFTCVFGARFLIEFVKERHVPATADLPLSMGQMLSIPLIALGVGVMWWARAAKKSG